MSSCTVLGWIQVLDLDYAKIFIPNLIFDLQQLFFYINEETFDSTQEKKGVWKFPLKARACITRGIAFVRPARPIASCFK